MEHSPKYQKVREYYGRGLWTRAMVEQAVDRWITRSECSEILKEQ